MISFQQLEEAHLLQVLEWRTSPSITKYMYTDIEKNMDHQKKWFEQVKYDKSQQYWIIQYKNENIGLFSLSNINKLNQTVSSGFYIGNLAYAIFSSRLIPYFLNYVFQTLQFNKLNIEILSNNKNVLKMHMHYGFRHVGTLKQQIRKNEGFLDVELLELLREDWMSKFTKYHSLQPIIIYQNKEVKNDAEYRKI